MSPVGQQLRQAREAQNLTEQQVAEITKLRTDHVRAIEEGNFEVFAARVYVRGIIRTYAGLLKLDVPAILKQLNEELEGSSIHKEAPALTPQNRSFADGVMFQLSRINWKIMAPLVAGCLLILGVIWGIRVWQEVASRDPLAELPEGIYKPAEPLAVETLPIPGAPGVITNK